jgi:hypothetical protein
VGNPGGPLTAPGEIVYLPAPDKGKMLVAVPVTLW